MTTQGGQEVEEQNQNQAVDLTQDMRAYSESVAQAADVVNNESEKQAELDAKAAIVAQAEAANSAAIDSPAAATTTQTSSKAAAKSANVAEMADAQAKAEKQRKLQYEADRQSALDQGYTPEQAETYAKQEEALAAAQAQTASPAGKPQITPEEPASSTKATTATTNDIGPASGQTIVPPT